MFEVLKTSQSRGEYSVFYHRFIKTNKIYSKGIWQQISQSQAYKIWLGNAFESLCYKHISQIKNVLGISGVYTETSMYNQLGNKKNNGFQIDLIIDRKDATINLCEIKYYTSIFTIEKSYYEQLLARKQHFIHHIKTKKQVFYTFVTAFGVTENKYSLDIVDSEINLTELFKPE